MDSFMRLFKTPLKKQFKNKFEEAIKCYDKSSDLITNSTYLFNQRAICLMKLGKYEEAMKYFEHSRSLNKY